MLSLMKQILCMISGHQNKKTFFTSYTACENFPTVMQAPQPIHHGSHHRTMSDMSLNFSCYYYFPCCHSGFFEQGVVHPELEGCLSVARSQLSRMAW